MDYLRPVYPAATLCRRATCFAGICMHHHPCRPCFETQERKHSWKTLAHTVIASASDAAGCEQEAGPHLGWWCGYANVRVSGCCHGGSADVGGGSAGARGQVRQQVQRAAVNERPESCGLAQTNSRQA